MERHDLRSQIGAQLSLGRVSYQKWLVKGQGLLWADLSGAKLEQIQPVMRRNDGAAPYNRAIFRISLSNNPAKYCAAIALRN